ncbi:hypothetical protein N3K66_008341 [Trichothecium roseum]|uniref:Uncharacterized protein n=1 Tax=Trichothecium roseum TaxID=47278 RepID=A0ACC0URM0_9HYPO|nr:hypothetical protein N3K66_008341 [Trichothecium roseum]
MTNILDLVPDIVRQAALEGGVENVTVDASKNGAIGSISRALKQAYAAGDYNTIRDYSDKAASDINPIYENMRHNAQDAFFKLHNESDNRDYYMSISGPRSNPTGYYWAYCPDVSTGMAQAVEPAGQIGTYSVSSQTLGISNMIWGNKWSNMTAGTLAALLAGFAARYAFNRISGMVISAAADAAGAATGEALVAAGIISSAAWAGVAGLAASVIVGAVIGAAAYFLISFIADFMVRDYWIGFSIYNWDLSNTYKVTQYHEDNSEWSGGGSFKIVELEVGGNTVKMPDGTIKPGPETIYSYGGFILKNSKTVFEGLGAGFRVESEDGSTGFQCAYECPRFKDNRLALLGGLDKSLDDFYDDGGNWADKGSYTAKSFIPKTNVPIICTTDALSGRDDHFYTFDVHIGLKPDSSFGKPREPAPEKPLRPKPEMPRMPGTGEEVRLPGGRVVGIRSIGMP